MNRFGGIVRALFYAVLAVFGLGSVLFASAQEKVPQPKTRPYQERDARNAQGFVWVQEVLNRDVVQLELSRLYVELYENNVLPTQAITLKKGDTPTKVMIRGGAWPKWLKGHLALALDSMLCDINPRICKRAKIIASKKSSKRSLSTLGKTQATAGDWTAAWPGRQILVPKMNLSLIYAAAIRVPPDGKKNRRSVSVVRTADFLQLYCRQFPTNAKHCASRNEKGNWESDEPIIYQYRSDGNIDPNTFRDISSSDLLRKLGGDEKGPKLLAVPTLKVEANIAEVKLQTVVKGSKEISKRGLIQMAPKGQSSNGAAANIVNGFVDEEGKLLVKWSPVNPVRNIRIVHVDEPAELKHCIFKDLVSRGLLELKIWNRETSAFEPFIFQEQEQEPLPNVEAVTASSCGEFNSTALVQGNHGTHTLGLLAKLATSGNFPEITPGTTPSPEHVWPVTIFHIPTSSSDVGASKLILALQNAAQLWPSIVSMSLSWPSAGNGQIAKVLRDNFRFSLVVVSAGNEREREGCNRLPACIENAPNVISVVALEPDETGALKLNNRSNAGARYHDIGAVASNIVGPIKGNWTGAFSGTSQAAPMVAATASFLARNGIRDLPPILRRLWSTAGLQPDLLPFARVTIVNAARATDFLHDHVALDSGCRMRGRLKRVGGDIRSLSVTVLDETLSQDQIDWRSILRLYRKPGTGDHIIMHTLNSKFVQRDYGLKTTDLERDVIFNAEEMTQCDGRSDGPVQRFTLGEVSDLIISEYKEQ